MNSEAFYALSSFPNAYQEAVGPQGLLCPSATFWFFCFFFLACNTHRKGCGLIDIFKHFAGYTDSNIYGFVV